MTHDFSQVLAQQRSMTLDIEHKGKTKRFEFVLTRSQLSELTSDLTRARSGQISMADIAQNWIMELVVDDQAQALFEIVSHADNWTLPVSIFDHIGTMAAKTGAQVKKVRAGGKEKKGASKGG